MLILTLLAALLALAGLLMMSMARTEKEQACACIFMVILATCVIALLAMIVL